tara:strand:+ start:200 stop:439 length:240 start_codon:yes stop_codon:yes gene_type:complete
MVTKLPRRTVRIDDFRTVTFFLKSRRGYGFDDYYINAAKDIISSDLKNIDILNEVSNVRIVLDDWYFQEKKETSPGMIL